MRLSEPLHALLTQTETQIQADFDQALSPPLLRACVMSDFVRDQLRKQPSWLAEWLANPPQWDARDYTASLHQVLADVADEVALQRALRLFRHRELCRLSILQSNGLASVEQIFGALSDLAEQLILGARDWLYRAMCEEYGVPCNEAGEAQELLVIGMGKLGGGELNFSSDIDLIFFFPDQGETVGKRRSIDNTKFFTRLGQRLIKALDDVTENGFVYRTDMRLRPFGDSGALAMSFNAMEHYYQEQGRDWERYAMVKAKILGEDLNNPAHRLWKKLMRPFVYRRYLDFGAIQALREMKQKISREVVRRGLTDNIKLGAGGIRESEFIVQTFQMVRGGRDKILQQRALLRVLPQIEALGLLAPEQVRALRESYLFHRHVENLLQAMEDKQTQTLPTDPLAQLRLVLGCQQITRGGLHDSCYEAVETMAYPIHDWASFLDQLHAEQAKVSAIFEHIIGEENSDAPSDAKPIWAEWRDILHYQMPLDELSAVLANYAVAESDYAAIHQRFLETFQVWVKRSIGLRGRSVLQSLLPRVFDLLFQRADYLILQPRILRILDQITTRTTYLELLLEREQILPQLFELCAQSVMIAEQIAAYPMLLDELIAHNSLSNVPSFSEYAPRLHEFLLRIPEEDEEQLIDGLRQFKQIQMLRIAAADILGVLPVMKISDHLTYLAEAILGCVVQLAWRQTVRRYGRPEHLAENEMDFAVIAYGKLGGIELGYNSDLDLVFLHDSPLEGETVGGKRSISSLQFYLKLAQKINAIFSLNTHAGVLYEVDMRLRPSGEAGLLVSTFNAFAEYQHDSAWTWETQALVRSRAVFGNEALRARFEAIRRDVLAKKRDLTQLGRDIVEMREKMIQNLASPEGSAQFQIKTDRGGITDIEFIAQYLVLAHSAQQPQMAAWSDNVRIFDSAEQCGILSAADAAILRESYTQLRNHVHHLNLRGERAVCTQGEFSTLREAVINQWQRLFSALFVSH